MSLTDYLGREIRRGPYLDIKTGEPIRVYNLEGSLFYADPYQTFEGKEMPPFLSQEISKNLIRIIDPLKISKLLLDTEYSDDSRSPPTDSLPRKDLTFRNRHLKH